MQDKSYRIERIGLWLSEDKKLPMAEGIHVLVIISNDYENVAADWPDNMKLFSEKYGFTFPYLVDKEQRIAKP